MESGGNINVLDAVEAANKVGAKRFALLLGRVLQGMVALKSTPSAIFNETELNQLVQILGAETLAEVKLLINFLIYIYNRLAFLRNQPEVAGFLKKNGMAPELVEAVIAAWRERSDKLISVLKKQTSCQDKELESFSWQLGVPLGMSVVQRTGTYLPVASGEVEAEAPIVVQKDIQAPQVDFIFKVKDNASGGVGTRSVVMNKEAAQDFFEQLELLQMKLDELTN